MRLSFVALAAAASVPGCFATVNTGPICAQRGTGYTDPAVPTVNGGFLPNSQACQDSCKSNPACSFFTFYIHSKACYLQGQNVSVTEFHDFAVRGPKVCPDEVVAPPETTPDCAVLGRGYDDPFVQHVNGAFLANAMTCQDSCKLNPMCYHFTFYNDTKACWLQGNNVAGWTPKTHSSAISAPKCCPLDRALVCSAPGEVALSVPPTIPRDTAALGGGSLELGIVGTDEVLGAVGPALDVPGPTGPNDASPTSPTSPTTDPLILVGQKFMPACAATGKGYNDPNVQKPQLFLADSLACQISCYSNPSCESFTFYQNKNACWLQGNSTTTFTNKNAVSGPKNCPGNPKPMIMVAWDAESGFAAQDAESAESAGKTGGVPWWGYVLVAMGVVGAGGATAFYFSNSKGSKKKKSSRGRALAVATDVEEAAGAEDAVAVPLMAGTDLHQMALPAGRTYRSAPPTGDSVATRAPSVIYSVAPPVFITSQPTSVSIQARGVSSPAVFDRLDTNGDGMLSRQEMARFGQAEAASLGARFG